MIDNMAVTAYGQSMVERIRMLTLMPDIYALDKFLHRFCRSLARTISVIIEVDTERITALYDISIPKLSCPARRIKDISTGGEYREINDFNPALLASED